jgi:hypothetical protein
VLSYVDHNCSITYPMFITPSSPGNGAATPGDTAGQGAAPPGDQVTRADSRGWPLPSPVPGLPYRLQEQEANAARNISLPRARVPRRGRAPTCDDGVTVAHIDTSLRTSSCGPTTEVSAHARRKSAAFSPAPGRRGQSRVVDLWSVRPTTYFSKALLYVHTSRHADAHTHRVF